MVGESTLGAAFHQAWQVVISGKKEMSRNVPIELNKNNPEYVDECEDKFCELPPESAALFSYFNNIDLFHSYLQHFKGDLSFFQSLEPLPQTGACVILIGPVDGELNVVILVAWLKNRTIMIESLR